MGNNLSNNDIQKNTQNNGGKKPNTQKNDFTVTKKIKTVDNNIVNKKQIQCQKYKLGQNPNSLKTFEETLKKQSEENLKKK